MQDYALITDFNGSEDIIQLGGRATDYVLGSSVSGASGKSIYRDSDRSGTFTSPDKLVGILENVQSVSLTDNSFLYV